MLNKIGQVGQLCSMELARLKPELTRLNESQRNKQRRFEELTAAMAKASNADERRRLDQERSRIAQEGRAGNTDSKKLEGEIANRTACVATTQSKLEALIAPKPTVKPPSKK